MKKIKRALISLSNKDNLISILKLLKKFEVEIISSGGTFKEIKRLGFKAIDVADYTNSAEILGGRVKTLHPKIHGGILMKRNDKKHQMDSVIYNFQEIDLVIVNFYPFEKVLRKTNNQKKIIENIDIGGPALARAAAKNYEDVAVLTNISQYEDFIIHLKKHKGSTSIEFRKILSSNAFIETAYYDSLISNYFNDSFGNIFPKKKIISAELIENLRYGENPHQKASIYSSGNLNLLKLNGKQLSYNNYNDLFAALNISKSLPKNKGAVIVKHANPCGVSVKSNKIESYKSALKCDPISAFGGVIAFNFKLNKKLAEEVVKVFYEVIVANGFEENALKILRAKKNLRLIDASKINITNSQNFISNLNSILFQTQDNQTFLKKNFRVVSKIKPNAKTLKDLIFAFNISRFVKSNAIVIAKEQTTLGIGSGQPSRLDSCKIAIDKLKKFHKEYSGDIVAASDAFFPFVDGIELLIQGGVKAIIQPSGSINDKEIIKFANETRTVLVFSKTRHFKH